MFKDSPTFMMIHNSEGSEGVQAARQISSLMAIDMLYYT